MSFVRGRFGVRRQRGVYAVAGMMLAALSITGCMGSGDAQESGGSASPSPRSARTALDEPCPDGVTLGLGAPFRGRDYAKFQAVDGTVYVSVGQVGTVGTDGPEPDEATVYVGALARPPTYDRQAGRVRGTIVSTTVVENSWSAIDLAAGRYWLTAANGWDVVIRSCETGGVVTAAEPAPAAS